MEFTFSCPSCGQHIAATSEYVGIRTTCPTCSHPFDVPAPETPQAEREEPIPPPPPLPAQSSKPTTKPCPMCGEQILTTAKKCKHCGEMLDGSLRAAVKPAAAPDKSAFDPNNLRPGQILGMLFLAGIVIVGLWLANSNSGSSSNPISDILKPSQSKLQDEVRQSIEQTWASKPETRDNKVRSFSLVHKGENQYDGLLEADIGGKQVSIPVEVTYDGKSFMWKIRPFF